MRGTVTFLSRNRGIVVVQWDDGFAVVENLGGDLDVGDELDGDWDALGSETVRNLTKSDTLDVFLEGSLGSPGQAIAEAARMGGGYPANWRG